MICVNLLGKPARPLSAVSRRSTVGLAALAVLAVGYLFEGVDSTSQQGAVQPGHAEALQLDQTLLHKPPQQSLAGIRLLELCQRIPTSLDFTSVTCNALGDYGIRGAVPADQVADLQQLLYTLQGATQSANLSYWRSGGVDQPNFQFAFSGRFGPGADAELKMLDRDQVSLLFGRLANWADQKGLDSLQVREPVELSLTSSLVHQRRRLTATGSYNQISNFAASLQEVGSEAAVDELVLVPLARSSEGLAQAQVFAVIDVLVQPPAK